MIANKNISTTTNANTGNSNSNGNSNGNGNNSTFSTNANFDHEKPLYLLAIIARTHVSKLVSLKTTVRRVYDAKLLDDERKKEKENISATGTGNGTSSSSDSHHHNYNHNHNHNQSISSNRIGGDKIKNNISLTSGSSFILTEYCYDCPYTESRLKELKVLIKTIVRGMPSLLSHIQVMQVRVQNMSYVAEAAAAAAAVANATKTQTQTHGSTTADTNAYAYGTLVGTGVNKQEDLVALAYEMRQLQSTYFRMALECCDVFTFDVPGSLNGDSDNNSNSISNSNNNGVEFSESGTPIPPQNQDLKSAVDYFVHAWVGSSSGSGSGSGNGSGNKSGSGSGNVNNSTTVDEQQQLTTYRSELFYEIFHHNIDFIFQLVSKPSSRSALVPWCLGALLP